MQANYIGLVSIKIYYLLSVCVCVHRSIFVHTSSWSLFEKFWTEKTCSRHLAARLKLGFHSSFLQQEQEREREKERKNQFLLFWFERERKDIFWTSHYFNNKKCLWSLIWLTHRYIKTFIFQYIIKKLLLYFFCLTIY